MKKRIILLLCVFSLISCQRIIDSYWEQKRAENAEENYTSPWRGSWGITYTGSMNGTMVMKVYKNGFVKVNNDDYFTGYAGHAHGEISSVKSSQTGFKFYGNLRVAHGTWKKGSLTGTWTATKQ